ncbi:putative splicing factor 3A subunit 1, SWAP/Surp superfamily [Helianthus anomalus]
MLPAEDDSDGQRSPTPASTEVVIPPPDIKRAVDGAARFVASIRPKYEKAIIAENAALPKYSFLNVADPYHAYYRQQVSELRAQYGPKGRSRESVSGHEAIVSERLRELEKRFEERLDEEPDTTIASPLTGELIPVHKLSQHMEDPKYKQQKERLFAKISETTHAQDDEIFASIVRLARIRPDIFGTKEEEFVNSVNEEIQRTLLNWEFDVVPYSPPPNMMDAANLPQHGVPEEPEPKRQRLLREGPSLAQRPGPDGKGQTFGEWWAESVRKRELRLERLRCMMQLDTS